MTVTGQQSGAVPGADLPREADIRARLYDITGSNPPVAERALLARMIDNFLTRSPILATLADEMRSPGGPPA